MSSLQYIKGIGKERARILNRLGIRSLTDIFYYLPFRYEDRRFIKKISELRYDTPETVRARVISSNLVKRKNISIFELGLSDGSGVLRAKWFNQPYLKNLFKNGQEVILYGIVKRDGYLGITYEMENPEYEIIDSDEETIHTGRIVPVYRLTRGITQKQLRRIIHSVLSEHIDSIHDYMPFRILEKLNMPPLREAIKYIHFPPPDADIELLNSSRSIYHRRLAFDELFLMQMGLFILKSSKMHERGISFNSEQRFINSLLGSLEFTLTDAQKRVLNEILEDMRKPYPMNRLLQGDVGSGKTVVALCAMLNAVECGYQACLMAPTEILAEQHFINIHRAVEKMGLRICLLSSGVSKKPLEEIRNGEMDIVVGTHALIQEDVVFRRLGLVVIDEQHRFGVMQRSILRSKGLNPDVLIMTATPIPRTLALTVYGDLDCSIIDEMPPNRKPVITKIMNQSQKKEIYNLILDEVKKGGQVYVVYPVIEESEELNLKSAINGRDSLQKIFPFLRIGLLHGRMKAEEKEDVMIRFKNKELDILVSTTVIEVGIDIPDATLMIIVHAERFGLSQLHQLRGRVGRGKRQSMCILLAYEPYTEDAKKRLEAMVKSNDGFFIAEQDLLIRGPGELTGTKQSGMPDFRIADIIRDADLVSLARRFAGELVGEDPQLSGYPQLRDALEDFWKGRIELLRTG